jgi:hypothetical protein
MPGNSERFIFSAKCRQSCAGQTIHSLLPTGAVFPWSYAEKAKLIANKERPNL